MNIFNSLTSESCLGKNGADFGIHSFVVDHKMYH